MTARDCTLILKNQTRTFLFDFSYFLIESLFRLYSFFFKYTTKELICFNLYLDVIFYWFLKRDCLLVSLVI